MGCAVCALRLPLALCADSNFSSQYIKASSLHETVQSLISKDGQVAVVEDENQLVVMDNPPRLELIRQTLRKLDSPRRQVRITALIYDVSLEDIERLGINWASSMKGATNAADAPSPLFSVDSVQAVPLAADAVHGAMTFMTTSDLFDLTAAVNALQTANDARLLADPNVVVLDREAANIRIVTEIPYQERTQTSEGGNIGTTAFREARITLDVTPRIFADNTIRMEVTPTFSRLAGFTDTVDPQPIIDTREAKTVVRIRDGQTLIIVGLRQRSDLGTYNGIPYLTDIKLLNLGEFFRGRSTTLRESELLVFIRPELVEYEYLGEPREATAYFTGRAILERLPVAEDDGDCYCYEPPYGDEWYDHGYDTEFRPDPHEAVESIPSGDVVPVPVYSSSDIPEVQPMSSTGPGKMTYGFDPTLRSRTRSQLSRPNARFDPPRTAVVPPTWQLQWTPSSDAQHQPPRLIHLPQNNGGTVWR